MITISPEEMEKRIDSLPDEVQDMLYSPEMYAAIKQISVKHQLHIDQMDLLEAETSQVMLGITETSQFPEILKQSLKVDNTQAGAIAKDIDEMLFSKIRDAMKKAYEQSTTAPEKSVIMPSAMAASAAAPATPAASPLSTDMQIDPPATSVPAPAPAKVVAPAPQMHEADVMLSESTVSLPTNPSNLPKKNETAAPATTKIEVPPTYKADPYREPIE
jgi:hypothetical protein